MDFIMRKHVTTTREFVRIESMSKLNRLEFIRLDIRPPTLRDVLHCETGSERFAGRADRWIADGAQQTQMLLDVGAAEDARFRLRIDRR
jgi:hypothetical protein